jgi:hypothetical protein
MSLDGLCRAVSQVKAAINPGSDEEQERLRYIEKLHTMSDEELQESWYAEHPELRPSLSREELIQSFLDIDIDAVPESLLKPEEQLGRVNYNDLLINHIEQDRVDAGTLQQLQRWHVWKEQMYGA